MGEYSPPSEVKIEYDNGSGVLQDISNFVQTINGVNVEQIVEEVSGFNETQERRLPIGKDRMEPVELSGIFRSGSNNVHDLFNRDTPDTPDSPTRSLKITLQSGSGGQFYTVETYVGMYNVNPDKNALTKYTVRLEPATTRVSGVNP